MSKTSPTMSHTPAQRKAWHAGKRRQHETMGAWINRVMNRNKNFAGAYTPNFLKRGLPYQPL